MVSHKCPNRATLLTCFRDQELRFTVHDSPDYYQLKVSVFNDDKKTELIGEAWVALEKIVVPGGGTNDLWHGLNCKGRYAGDIRIELTYYDTRPKLEKAEDSSAPTMSSMDQVGNGIGGPRQPKPIKRKPHQRSPDRVDPPRSSSPYGHDYNPGISPTDSRTENLRETRHFQGLCENQNGQDHNQDNEWDTDNINNWQMGRQAHPLQNRMVHSNSSPAVISLGHHKNMPYEWQETETLIEDDGPAPPPPPAHRSLPLTPPLNTRARGANTSSLPGSPLAKVQSNSPFAEYQPSTSPSQPANYLHQGMPPSLIPGYEPTNAKHNSQRMYERRMSERQQSLDQPSSQATPSFSAPRVGQPPLPRSVENTQERRAHRYSAPVDRFPNQVSKPRAVSPDPRPPMRKSLSPQPAHVQRTQSGIPLSPDSFDAYNPSIGAESSVNDPGPRYSTPEQAEDASRQHERREKLGDGPIIGSDGRIIDPSDHLPTDTWAPEPEQKTPTRRGLEVTVRFRNSPQGAQPMPPAGRRPLNDARTQSASTPLYAHNARNSPSDPLNRTRLQQYPRISHGDVPPPVPGKVPMGGGKEDWETDALSDEMRKIDIGTGRRRGLNNVY